MTYRSITVRLGVAEARHWCVRARPWQDKKRLCSCGLGTAKSPRLGTPRGQQDQLTARELLRPHCSIRRWKDSPHTQAAQTPSRDVVGEDSLENGNTGTKSISKEPNDASQTSSIFGCVRARWCHSGPKAATGSAKYASTLCRASLGCRGLDGKRGVPLMKLQHIKNYYSFVFSGFRQCNVIYSKKC